MEPSQRSGWVISLTVAAVAALLGFVAVYVTLAPRDNAGPAPDRPNVASPGAPAGENAVLPAGAGKNPLSTGQMAGFVFAKAPEPLPEIKFVDGSGAGRTLADWRGKTVLLNLWATWCAPCREEMPALDRLQKELGGDAFEVVALAVDKAGVKAARKFLDQIKVEKLALFVDPTARAGTTLRALGMPTTVLIDAEGREIGRLLGPAEWDSPEAKRLIEAALNK